VTME